MRNKEDSGKNQHRLYSFPQDHQKYEKEDIERRTLICQSVQPALNFSSELFCRPHHENDHAYDEDRGHQHHDALKNVLIEMQPGKNYRDGYTAEKSGAKRNVGKPSEIRAPDFVQVGENYAHNEGSFDPFTQGDCQSFQHIN